MKIEELEALAEKAAGDDKIERNSANLSLILALSRHRHEIIALLKAAKFYAAHGLSVPIYNKDGTCYFADEPLKKALAAFEEYGEAELP